MHYKSSIYLISLAAFLLLLGAFIFEYGFGFVPCKLCYVHRWIHGVACGVGLLAFVYPSKARLILVGLTAIMALSSVFSLFHVAVENNLISTFGFCAGPTGGQVRTLTDLMNLPVATGVECNVVQWSFLGISLAGYNGISSVLLMTLGLKFVSRGP